MKARKIDFLYQKFRSDYTFFHLNNLIIGRAKTTQTSNVHEFEPFMRKGISVFLLNLSTSPTRKA
jgi:hypothetical protein